MYCHSVIGVSACSCFGNYEAKLFVCQMGLAGFSWSEQCTLTQLSTYSLKHSLYAASSYILSNNYHTLRMQEKDCFEVVAC